MNHHDLRLALLLPLPPWLGFLLYRYRGRVGLGFGYFLGGVLAVLSLPWPQIGSHGLPSAQLGGALFGFSLFLQAHREGREGLRTLALGVGGATLFAWVVGTQLGLDMRSVLEFWGTALMEGGLWLGLSDLGYRLTKGRWLALRMPLAGGAAFLVATALFHFLPLGLKPLSWPASLLAGVLLGLVALQQLVWLRDHGIWVEGRGEGIRVALSALEGDQPPEGPALLYVIEGRQPMFLVNEKGLLLESNTAFSRLSGLARHQMKGYQLQDLFQGQDHAPWDELRDQLLQEHRGSVQATLVHRDSTFQNVKLEAVAFDRNMALVWIADPQAGTLSLRREGPEPLTRAGLHGEEHDPTRLPAQTAASNTLEARAALEALLPRWRRMLGADHQVTLETPELELFVEPDPLQRMVTQLLLHGRQALASGTLTVTLTPVRLGGRAWARLDLGLSGPAAPRREDFLGLSWLQQTVREALCMLELGRAPSGLLAPRLFLPCRDPQGLPGPLQGRRIWIQDQDPALLDSLCRLIREAGGEALPFQTLHGLLARTHGSALPELFVLERTLALERFHRSLRRVAIEARPILVLGDGRPLTPGEGTPGRLMLLEKPFPGQHFLQSLLALLQEA
jgi:PAS domain-containing protein